MTGLRIPACVLVCGGRHFNDRDAVFGVLDRLHAEHGVARVATGGATGADYWANQWAIAHGVAHATYPADWGAHGRAAGPIRNAHMLAREGPEFVVAFPGGRGTADMVRRAEAAGVPVLTPEVAV